MLQKKSLYSFVFQENIIIFALIKKQPQGVIISTFLAALIL